MSNIPAELMDFSKLRPATAGELQVVADGVERFSRWFNVPTVPPHRFEGRPADLSCLDWVFYELGGNLWYRDQGLSFTCCWSNVLVRGFGFEWAVIGEPRDFRDYLLRVPEEYTLFPWIRLWESVVNPCVQFEKASYPWLRILNEMEATSNPPDGWHPAIDAIRGNRPDFPHKVIQLLEEMSEAPDFILSLGMYPYEWGVETDWAMVEGMLRQRSRVRHDAPFRGVAE